MEKSFKQIRLIIVILFLTIMLIVTFYKVIKNREERLYSVLYGRIEYAYRSCYLKKECSDSITLNDLYEKEYLKTQYDPITKEMLDPNIKITYKDNEVKILK